MSGINTKFSQLLVFPHLYCYVIILFRYVRMRFVTVFWYLPHIFVPDRFISHVRKTAKSDCQVLRVCLIFCAHGTPRLQVDVFFYESWYLRIFPKCVEKIQVTLKPDKDKWYSTWRPIYSFIISLSFLLRMINVSDNSCRENQYTHFVFSNFFSRKSCHLWEIVEKYCRAGQAADDNMAHARCMVDN
jgi:hypothetical protein